MPIIKTQWDIAHQNYIMNYSVLKKSKWYFYKKKCKYFRFLAFYGHAMLFYRMVKRNIKTYFNALKFLFIPRLIANPTRYLKNYIFVDVPSPSLLILGLSYSLIKHIRGIDFQGSKWMRQWPINWYTYPMMIQKLPLQNIMISDWNV